jgi:hypothetical protein
MKLSNARFQWLWYYILRPIYRPKKPTKLLTGVELLEYYAPYMLAKIKWAKRLTDLNCAGIGDSNKKEMDDYESMRRFDKPTINLGISGTRADDWADFLYGTEKGNKVYKEISTLPNVLVNVGGNNILQNRFEILHDALNFLSGKFPQATFITIPYIYADLVSKLTGKSPDSIRNEIIQANEWIKQYRNIDITSFTGSGGEPYWFALKDLVHFSDEFDYKIRIPLINFRLWGVK